MRKLIRYMTRAALRMSPRKTHQCCLCEHDIGGFISYQGGWKAAPPLMKALEIVGSDLDHFTCPVCLSHDRERHLWLYLQASKLLGEMRGSHILHFAPERHLSAKIILQNPTNHIKADLYPTAPDIQKVDLLAIPFADASFDFVIANHVLEHVADDQKALTEIVRVLKPDGCAILQTPYAASLQHTWEDPGILSKQQRLFAYGQNDHVRLYGQDIFGRIAAAGLTPHIRQHTELLGEIDAYQQGVNPREPFMLFKKS